MDAREADEAGREGGFFTRVVLLQQLVKRIMRNEIK
jgi:hypothetical protein